MRASSSPFLASRRADAVRWPVIPQVAAWIREHPGTLSLGQGVAGYGPPAAALDTLRTFGSDVLRHRYQPAAGLPELVAALRRRMESVRGVTMGPERALMVTAGANAGFLQSILAICDEGDDTLLPAPFYFNQEMALTLAGVRTVLVPTDSRGHPEVAAIEAAIGPRTRAVVTVSPNNPTGAVYGRGLLEAINALCARRGIFHISDETYEHFVHGAEPHVSPGAFPGSAAHTLSLHSFSKAYGLASWRVGYVVYPAALESAMTKIQDTHLICAPGISQAMALACLDAGESWVAERMREVRATRTAVLRGLDGLGEWVGRGEAEGAFYVWLNLRLPFDSIELTRRLIAEHRVAVIPGAAFGVTEGCAVRLAYGALTVQTASDAVERFATGIRALAGA